MIIKDLYRYHGENGAIDTLIKLPMEFDAMLRIEAEPGMVLTDGEDTATVRDIPTAELDNWYEIESDEAPDTDYDASEADYIAALKELGVNTDD